jgi:general secretion pathway protein E
VDAAGARVGRRAAVSAGTPFAGAAAARLGIPPDVLARAATRTRAGRPLADALADLGAADPAAFARALADAAGLPFAATLPAPARELAALLPMPFAKRHLVLPLGRDGAGIDVALADPAALAPLDDIRFLAGVPVRPVVAPAPVLREAITRAYDAAAGTAADTMDAIAGDRLEFDATPGEPLDLLEVGDDTPVIRLVNALFSQAVRDGASDVHVEPYERTLAVRFRVDGVLHDVLSPPAALHASLVSRLKIMAGLDIAERRLPQDGRIRLRVGGRDVDVRVSVVPTGFGERVALRILDRATALLDLADLGLAPATGRALDRLLGQSHGLVLVTGPTGSGKTTTLYAALRRLATGERNIMTIEDPIEYQLRGIAQMQANPRIGLDFAAGLRAVLRQDPDVILVGEIRDRATVEIALQAALTGHLVFSTLHTNDACGAVTRLLDMGVEPFLISSSVLGVLAQRLVRRLCAACAVDGPPTAEERDALGAAPPDLLRHAGAGCAACRGTGYRGRTAVHELLVVDDAVRGLVMARADAAAIRRHATAAGMPTLRDDGCAKAARGVTTLAEVMRGTQDDG